jgi:M3 family oligoendopeptidase
MTQTASPLSAQAPATLSDLTVNAPTLSDIQALTQTVLTQLDAAPNVAEKRTIIAHWDAERRRIDTWSSLVYVRFAQNTQSLQAKADRDYADSLLPDWTDCQVRVKQRLLADPDRPELARQWGHHIFALWQLDVDAFDPALKADMVEEATLTAQYTALCASAAIPFNGETLNLSGLRAWLDNADRATRHAAHQAYWGFFHQHQATLDTLFDQLVTLRHRMAQTLGFETFTPLGYRHMQRLDYDAADVDRYRLQVQTDIVPLCQAILARRQHALGLDTMMYWDEGLADCTGNPVPALGPAMLPAAQALFDQTSPALGRFFTLLQDKGLIDLDARAGKAGGGFCTFLPTAGWPFIFCNSNGSMADAVTLVHEVGHAFQAYSSQHVPLLDLQWPTSESAEIHSMSLEFLTFDAAAHLFGHNAADAERYRRIHLEDSLLFLPFGVAVDHFQHLVYAQPQATPAERHAMWQHVEALYMPWRQYGDLAGLNAGGLWHQKQHIFNSPFYYIDYTLAQCCALQFWAKSRTDAAAAMADYIALCSRGGTAPFQTLVQSAGLMSPFKPGALKTVAETVRQALGLS